MKASRDYCPKGWQHKHSFHDYSYWSGKHPRCSKCGWEDKTRVLKEYEKDDNKDKRSS